MMKKKLFACLLSAAMVLSLAACGGTSETETTGTDADTSGSEGQTYTCLLYTSRCV